MFTRHILKFPETKISYTLKRSIGTKKITLKVNPSKGLVVTIPSWASKAQYEDFIKKNCVWINDQLSKISSKGNSLSKRNSYLESKVVAKKLLKDKVSKLNEHYGFEYNRIVIKDQSSRWGSCSTLKNLNFNYRIVHLPEELQDYIVVHELCHLKEMNHSQSFWNLVSETIPNYRTLRRQLRKYEKDLF